MGSAAEPLSWDAVSSWLARLRKGADQDLLRVKGIVNLIGEHAPVAIHGVHHVFHPPVQLEGWPDADQRFRIVFITNRARRPAREFRRACRRHAHLGRGLASGSRHSIGASGRRIRSETSRAASRGRYYLHNMETPLL